MLRSEKVHSTLVECVVDFQYHGLQPFANAVQVPERDRVELVAKKAWGRHQVGVRIGCRVSPLTESTLR